jgi:AcrR family transcriptional regulator
VTAVGRRDDVIEAATAILRESGPDALTSVNVARRMGVTQPAIYRHVRDMEELTTIASQAVVDEVFALVGVAAAAPESEWSEGTYIAEFAVRIARLFTESRRGFEIIDRWRHDPSPLGTGIRATLRTAADMIAAMLEDQWRTDLDHHEPFGSDALLAQAGHARLMTDDVVSVARIATASVPAMSADEASRLLSLRVFSGWSAYALHMAALCHLATPELDGPCLKIPRLQPA